MKPDIKQSVAIDTVPLPESAIRVSIPAKIAFDLKSFEKIQASILDRLGCHACCSGWDIRWNIIREFGVDEKLNVREIAGGL